MTTRDLPISPGVSEDRTEPDDRPPNSKAYECTIGIVVVAVGVAVYFASASIDIAREGQQFGPRWWPTALAVSMVAIGLVLITSALLTRISSDEPSITKSGTVALAATLAAIVVYGFAWQYFDFRVVTVILLAAITAVSGGRGIKALVLFPIVTTLILWAIFGLLLRVPL
ncbi:hypothetical protein CH304_17875 [Rhodococcus sp. 15-649-1-2]|nr:MULTISPECIES: tripartite tricarboxylate transporter TctB family protein [unclassified Rhodococcus (in: high G+C Gram-positive bacteria)]OZC84310.1 hypothetical protein CH282_14265 [Rhodococcus sp. 06-418-1B]OZE79973.1 hypothetical protein CH304_17875 [Rhodococcus sp. 15-649-1-2]